ncbi:MAG: hypothetical protein IPJ88_04680 [Myxococcales bacterium]|nr:MAG: hypothetical protein IPJ88_04680 [Myxococcales bacterium]
MRERREPVDKLFVLGAGASHSTTLKKKAENRSPLDKDFCERIEALKKLQRPGWVKPTSERVEKGWLDAAEFKKCGLEEAIVKQVSHLEFIQNFHSRRLKGKRSADEFLNDIAHLILCGLKSISEDHRETYKKFAKHVFPKDKSSTWKNRVISFNYDCMFERHLLKQNIGCARIYGEDVRTNQTKKKNPRNKNTPLVVKLHGSTNWRSNTEEFKKVIQTATETEPNESQKENQTKIDEPKKAIQTGSKPELNDSQRENEAKTKAQIQMTVWVENGMAIPAPDDKISPCIVPPLPRKPVAKIEVFRKLWDWAYEYLHEAKELVICGYSLPDSDDMAKAMFGNFKNSKLKKVTIVDPDAAIIKKWRDLLRRKGVADASWEYHDDFAQYVESLSR